MDPGRLQGMVEFNDVSFSYDGKRPAIADLSFTALPGETIALVGATGAGKSTAIALLHRAFDPQSGIISIDGMDVRALTLSGLRPEHRRRVPGGAAVQSLHRRQPARRQAGCDRTKSCALPLRAPRRSISSNAAITVSTPMPASVAACCPAASGSGCRSRALLKDPPILILDEATSALDAVTEAKLNVALDEVMKGRTTFVIAHRLSTIRNATRILVFENGRVIEAGTFDELVMQGGYFASLAAAQFMVQEDARASMAPARCCRTPLMSLENRSKFGPFHHRFNRLATVLMLSAGIVCSRHRVTADRHESPEPQIQELLRAVLEHCRRAAKDRNRIVQFHFASRRLLSLNWFILTAALALGVTAPRTASAEALLLVEADTGKVLQAENATYPWHSASVTKLMTTYVTLQAVKQGRINLDTVVTVSPIASAQSPSKMGFKAGTQVTIDNALKMMMVKSANDMAVVLAEGVGGSVDGFSAMMNATAQKLGMTQTHYVNPNGLPADEQVTSARDLAILARAIIRDLPEYEYFVHIPAIKFGRRITPNFNKLIGRYPGADGMKTGFICASGYNLVATATRGNKRLIAVVLGALVRPARAPSRPRSCWSAASTPAQAA